MPSKVRSVLHPTSVRSPMARRILAVAAAAGLGICLSSACATGSGGETPDHGRQFEQRREQQFERHGLWQRFRRELLPVVASSSGTKPGAAAAGALPAANSSSSSR